ncbi:hypothetical protein GTP38_04800 [Duganella sp. FT94W]|uniref:FeoB-associated Cys-rich membrane protein n=1 Tax=Duganella lactea TaxID=2692173 RepID=A0ABW9V1T3_9BURK|nr:DUF6587 family protein [Duganella lactea]MYM33656.1 hypothetical protein [Duganella lactea]
MWQELMVALIVAGALVHFSTKYLPLAWRRRIVYTLGKRGFNETKLARFFKTSGGGGCGSGCSDCAPSTSTSCDSKSTTTSKQRVIKLHVQR